MGKKIEHFYDIYDDDDDIRDNSNYPSDDEDGYNQNPAQMKSKFDAYVKRLGLKKEQLYLDKEEAIELMKRYHSGTAEDKANVIERIVYSQMYFIFSQMNKRAKEFLKQNPEREDEMINECVLEIMAAIPRYKPEDGAPTTYFATCIFHGISKIKETTLNNTSVSKGKVVKMMREAIQSFSAQGIEPTVDMLAIYTGKTVAEVKKVMAGLGLADPVSIADIDPDDTRLVNEDMSVEDKVILQEQTEALYTALSSLNDMEKKIISLYFYENMSKNAIAAYLGINPNEVSNTINHTLKELRKNPTLKSYQDMARKEQQWKKKRAGIKEIAPTNLAEETYACFDDDFVGDDMILLSGEEESKLKKNDDEDDDIFITSDD